MVISLRQDEKKSMDDGYVNTIIQIKGLGFILMMTRLKLYGIIIVPLGRQSQS